MNGIGNLLYMTPALKVLKQKWDYRLVLITDKKFFRVSGLVEVAEPIFDDYETSYTHRSTFDFTLAAGWSLPLSYQPYAKINSPRFRAIPWFREGIHETLGYLEMAGATWADFDGYWFESDKTGPELPPDKRPTIALANASPGNVAQHKLWHRFPELSILLQQMGYRVVLVGLTDELEGCVGDLDFRGTVSFRQSARVIEQCDALIATSTGMYVVADTMKTPVVAVEGPMLFQKVRPIQTDYELARRFVSCSPCFQTPFWKSCTGPECMGLVEPGDCVQALRRLLAPGRKPRRTIPKIVDKLERIEVTSEETQEFPYKVSLLVPCVDRYVYLRACLDSLRTSGLPKGSRVLFLNDNSIDPRVQEALDSFEVSGVEKHIFQTNPQEKRDLLEISTVNPSVFAYNRLLNELENLDKSDPGDYVFLLDSDMLLKQNWIQRSVLSLREVQRDYPRVEIVCALHAAHPVYDLPESPVVQTSFGSVKFRNGTSLPYGMAASFCRNVHGPFDEGSTTRSLDLSKSGELLERGVEFVCTVPSLAQHDGAFGTSFQRSKPALLAEDF